MTDMTIDDLKEKMADIDLTMFVTQTEGGKLAGRPMSNNGQVDAEGDCYFFCMDDTRTVHDIRARPEVVLCYEGKAGLLGKPPMFVTLQGRAEVIQDRARMEDHWTPDLEIWFEKGLDTPGIAMLKVRAERLHYWAGRDEGDFVL